MYNAQNMCSLNISTSTDSHSSHFSMCVQRLKHTESDKLQVQIQAYLDNLFDVGTLLEDAETKNAALERVEELEESLSHVQRIKLMFTPSSPLF